MGEPQTGTHCKEKERAKKDMEEMLDYIDKLNELDVSGVEPMSHVFSMSWFLTAPELSSTPLHTISYW